MKNAYSNIGIPRIPRIAAIITAVGLAAALSPTATAQSLNVTLLSQVPGDGNDCWGYTSPSGREYALQGNNSNVTFIEITDPTNPVILDVIPHVGSLWCDIKVYQDFAYSVAESSGSGIHVYDLSDIDNGNITLVRNIPDVGRSHNIAIDHDSNFLYTLGSRNSGGTTTCWDLTDPANPVQVGAASVTTNYQHDAQIVTYTSGPYAGKQILLGQAGGLGLEIYDVTDKNNPVLMSTTVYPNLAYCHQGWLSDDRNYFYVNDEGDESNFGITTRTLIFDVSDLSNPVLVNTFTTGLASIDHNLYWKDGFLFEANYTSGLRVIDACDPVNLTEVGYYDTYPANNSSGGGGAWGCFPFFPSGNCLISNMNGDLYIVDPSAAVAAGCTPPCYPDCDQSTGVGVLDIFDFLCFQNDFVKGDPNGYACSCTNPGPSVCDIFDFLCFQNAFVAGCP